MSAPLKNIYLTHIEECRICLAECHRCIAQTTADQACHHCLEDCASTLASAIRLMEQKSPLASRYLVDCAEVCEACAECCSKFDNPYAKRCVEICIATVNCCRKGSVIDV